LRAIFKNFIPYWKVIVVIVVLLIMQAYCDLSLPQYTQAIIDVGIQNRGVEHIVPAKMTADEYESAQIFMNDSEKKTWESLFRKEGKYYERKVNDEEALEEADTELLTPLVLTYQLGHMSEKNFRSTVKENLKKNPKTAMMADKIDDMTVQAIEDMMRIHVKTFRAEDENGRVKTYFDMRPVLQTMISKGMMDDSQIGKSRKQADEMIESAGGRTLKSMGCAYAVKCDREAGVDVDKIQTSYLWACGRRMLLMALLMLCAAGCVAFLASRVGADVGRDLRSRLFRRVMLFSNAEMDQFSTSSLITRATNDIQQVQLVSTLLLRMLIYAPVMGIWGIIKVAGTGAHMSWVIVLGVCVIVSVVLLLMSLALPKFRIMQKLVDALNGVSREILTGLQVIRAFGREEKEEERFDKANTDLMKTQLFTNRVMTFMMPSMTLIMYSLVVLITWVAAHKIDAGNLQVGAMTAFITYSIMIVMSFMIITMMSILLPRAGIAAGRVDEVLSTQPTILEKEETLEVTQHSGRVEFRHVDFRYPGAERNVLTDIDFTAEPGQTTAIIGSTGSGKSTIVNLLPRFYDVSGGSVAVDGVDVRDMKLHSLRERIGLVPQKGVLFSGTIASNIRFGNRDATDEEVREAAEIAQATGFIEEKEDQFDSFISQGGSNVSGGQKQRLSIARALAKKPEVLIFDDSFSALDMKTDAKLRKVLAEKEKDTTKIIVAQRISTVLAADQIIVLDEGRIVGKGTHDELMVSCDVYRQIAESQLSQNELEGI